MESDQTELLVIAEHVCFTSPIIPNYTPKIQKGVSSARSDDTKNLKGVVLDWIFPRDGDTRNFLPIDPPPQPLGQNIKTTQGFNHPLTGALLCPAGLDYKDEERVP